MNTKVLFLSLLLCACAKNVSSPMTSSTYQSAETSSIAGRIRAQAKMTPMYSTRSPCEPSVKVALAVVAPTPIPGAEPKQQLIVDDIYLQCVTPMERPSARRIYQVTDVARTDIGIVYHAEGEEGSVVSLTDFSGLTTSDGKAVAPAWIFIEQGKSYLADAAAIRK